MTAYEDAVDSLRDEFLKSLSVGRVGGHADAAQKVAEKFVDSIIRLKNEGTLFGNDGGTEESQDGLGPLRRLGQADVLLVSHALQATVLRLAELAEKDDVTIMKLKLGKKSSLQTVPLFLDSVMCMVLENSPPLELSAPSMCLETLTEVTIATECTQIFDYLDSRLDAFTRQGVRQKSQYTLLRTCNVLLKRLSKSQDAELCGRVLMFLAKFLPLTERSGVNMYGSFHTENLTPLETVRSGDLDALGNPIDTSFYETFWGLQKWFSDPALALSPGAWDTISQALDTVLQQFSGTPVTVTEAPRTSGKQRKDLEEREDASSVKYLSSARLLSLQVRDASFRRNFLIQSLILIGWIENPLLKDWINKKPNERTIESLRVMRDRIMKHLKSIPEQGETFAEAIDKVLQGEEAWVIWKQAGCPADPFQVPKKHLFDELNKIELFSPIKKPKKSPVAVFGVELGVPELDRLWNLTEDNLSMLSADDRGGFSSLRQLMEPVIDEMNEPDEDDTFSVSKDAIYNWKTLRLVARASLPAYAAAVRAGGDLKVAARLLYPDDVPPAKVEAVEDDAPIEEIMEEFDRDKMQIDLEHKEVEEVKVEEAMVMEEDQEVKEENLEVKEEDEGISTQNRSPHDNVAKQEDLQMNGNSQNQKSKDCTEDPLPADSKEISEQEEAIDIE